MERDEQLRAGMEQREIGRHALALEHFTTAAEDAIRADDRCAAVAFAAQLTLTLDRPYEAIAWSERLRSDSATPDEANLLEASAWVALGDGAQALALLDEVSEPDTDDTTYPPTLVHQLRCQAHGFEGNAEAALREACTALSSDWALAEIWRALAVLAAQHEVDVTEVVGRIPDDGLMQVLGWLLESPAAGVDQIVEALWQRNPGDQRVLALVTSLGNRLPLERAMEWSARLRAAGLVKECAVLGIAASETRPARERMRAAAVAAGAFGDERAVPLLEVATTALGDEELAETFDEMLQLAPDDLFDAFIVAGATNARRSLTLAGQLLERGAADAAVALARHAAEQTTGQPDELRRALTALSGRSMGSLMGQLRGRGETTVAALFEVASGDRSGGCGGV